MEEKVCGSFRCRLCRARLHGWAEYKKLAKKEYIVSDLAHVNALITHNTPRNRISEPLPMLPIFLVRFISTNSDRSWYLERIIVVINSAISSVLTAEASVPPRVTAAWWDITLTLLTFKSLCWCSDWAARILCKQSLTVRELKLLNSN